MATFKRGNVWWYKFTWRGELIRESTKQSNKRTAEQIEAAHKAALAKGEVGIREKKPVPTLEQFLKADFLPYIRATKAAKAKTVCFYSTCAANLTAYPKLSGLPLDHITAEHIAGYIAHRQTAGMQISTVNRELATLRRAFHIALEWGKISSVIPRIRLLPGENHRERVLTPMEESKYLEAALDLGHGQMEAYRRALEGIRAVQRGQQPRKPDAFLLRDVVTVLIDCGLRPEECFRLRWQDNVRDGAIEVHIGKGRGSRRRIPASKRVLAVLEMRRAAATPGSEWVFPSETKSGHIEGFTLKKQHAAALKASGVAPFVLYTLRHTCITRWAKHMDPFTLRVLAGHMDLNTTKRYVHPNEADILEAMEKVQGGHKIGHTEAQPAFATSKGTAVIN